MLRSSSFSSVFLTLYYPCTVPYHHYPERVTSQQYSIFIVEKTLFQAFIMYHPSIKHHSSQVTVDEQSYFLLSHFLLYHLHEVTKDCTLHLLGLLLPVLHSTLDYRPA